MCLLNLLVVTGLGVGAFLALVAVLGRKWAVLDILNNGLPYTVAGAIAVTVLAALTGDWRLIVASALVAAVVIVSLLDGVSGAAPRASPGHERLLRIATLNLWRHNVDMDGVAAFLLAVDADIVILQEVTEENGGTLLPQLAAQYPHAIGETGLVIRSKHPLGGAGQIDIPGLDYWRSPVIRWAEIEIQGKRVEIAGVHIAYPFHPGQQWLDIATLTQFARGRTAPLIVAGDFNTTPWTGLLKGFTKGSGLKRCNAFRLTWPMRLGKLPAVPLVAIDNVFVSAGLAAVATEGGPRLSSDHRPLIADIALA
jgi:endonuclease/exonuclease/phosphatase (EEP) superfamily protein YafD